MGRYALFRLTRAKGKDMEETLDFDLDAPASGLGSTSRQRDRGSLYAIRMLLRHNEICCRLMEDPEALLRLLGSNAPWPEELAKRFLEAAQDDDDDAAPAAVQDLPRFMRRLKTRSAWSRYSQAISRAYLEEPHLILSTLETYEASLRDQEHPTESQNAATLSNLLGLTRSERSLVEFAECRAFSLFRDVLRAISGFALSEAYQYIASAIEAPVQEVRAALRTNAALRTYRLIRLDTSPNDLEDFLRLDANGESLLTEEFGHPDEMLELIVQPGAPGTLTVDDFPHLSDELTLLTRYLANASKKQVKGCNILLYGPPGTGKTEFARLLAKQAGLSQFDIRSCNNEGDSIVKQDRIAFFALAQRFLAESGQATVLFDEIEDVFPSESFSFAMLFGRGKGSRSTSQSKAWINQVLETSPVPAIWITNDVEAIDEAYLRRFAYHIEFRQPPRQVRSRVIARCLGSYADHHELIARLANDDTLSPGQLAQAAKFAEVCALSTDQSVDDVLINALKASQTAVGRPLKSHIGSSGQHACNFEYLNVDSEFPLEKIEHALRRHGHGTLCFYGVPGSGKTSLGKHLADAVGRPLLIKRASDLLGKYVGESEKAMASMFREAEQTGAVLLLDEADSFLRRRERASNSWEVTLVNELLQQMEVFQGIFICTTNLMDAVDEAALRRFTFKVRFDALTLTQRTRLFAERCLGGTSEALPQSIQQQLAQLNALTPGDFATVSRQEYLLGETYSPAEYLKQLARECSVKHAQASNAIGFIR